MAKKKEIIVQNEGELVPYNFPEYSVTVLARSMEDALEKFAKLGLREEKN